MNSKVPVHLICGFLGSGKTTLLRRILAEQPPAERLVVLVNEFGQLGIDGKLLSGFDSEVRELASGCICCTIKADFQTSLNQMLKDFEPDRIVVEATGIAETGELAEAVRQVAARSDLELSSVVTVVDAENFKYRDALGPLFFNQMKAADLILLNKTDLVDADEVAELTQALAEVNPRARIMPVVHCAADREMILHPLPERERPSALDAGLAASQLETLPLLAGPPGEDLIEHAAYDSTKGFQAFSFQQPGIFDPDCFQNFLNQLPWGVFRVKGFVRFPKGTSIVNYTYHRPEISPTEPEPENRLAFVTWEIDQTDILQKLEACVLTQEAGS